MWPTAHGRGPFVTQHHDGAPGGRRQRHLSKYFMKSRTKRARTCQSRWRQAAPRTHVGLHMGAILIQWANGIESCFQYRVMTGSVWQATIQTAKNQSEERFGSLAEVWQRGFPVDLWWKVSNKEVKTKNRNSFNFYGNSEMYAIWMIILTLELIINVCRKHCIFPNNHRES